MQRDVNKWLEDILTNGSDALEFLDGKSESDYLADKALRAMVERKLFVVGEAVAHLRSDFPQIASKLTAVDEIVGFRNVLAHGYFALNHRRVYDIATANLPSLIEEAAGLIR
jgi:uncharacterized protein with HEPN domain